MTNSSSQPKRKSRFVSGCLAAHRLAGIITGLLFLVIAGTGFLLIFLSELNLRGHRAIARGGELVHYAPAVAEFVRKHPDSSLLSIYVPLEKADRKSWQIFIRTGVDRKEIRVADFDPTTGIILADRDYKKSLFNTILQLHYSFLSGVAGEVVAWLISICLVLLSVTGVYIYRGAIRDLFRWRVKRNASTRANTVWLHKWAGFWALSLALVWGITGFCYLLAITPRSFKPPPPPPPTTSPVSIEALADFPAMHRLASAQFPERPLINIRPILKDSQTPEVRFRFLFRDAAPWHKFGEVVINGQDGSLISVLHPEDRPLRDKYVSTLAALHFGFYGGPIMHLLWGLGGAVMVFLPTSGYIMWYLRRK